MSSIPTWRFVLLNFTGAFLWAVVIGSAGYVFGSVLEAIIGDIKRYELETVGAITIIGILVWTVHLCLDRKKYGSSIRSERDS
jgi:membrane protein DedA with SNARE-associated domain